MAHTLPLRKEIGENPNKKISVQQHLTNAERKLKLIEEQEMVTIKPIITFPQYNPNYLPDEVKLALQVLKNHKVQLVIQAAAKE